MSDLQRIREARQDGCIEALNYYFDEILAKGKSLSEHQLQDYKEKCEILQCMGEQANKYAEFMLSIV